MTVPFITTDELSAYIGSDATGSEGEFACLAACRTIIDWLDNELVLEFDVAVRLDGTGTDALVLPKQPIRLVTSVVESGVDLVEDVDYFLGSAGILYRADGVYPGSYRWPIGRGNIHVVYDRGFDLLPVGPYEPEVDQPFPEDIKMVALSLAKRIFAAGALPVGGFKSETMGQYSYELADAAAASGVFVLQDGERSILARYKDHGAA